MIQKRIIQREKEEDPRAQKRFKEDFGDDKNETTNHSMFDSLGELHMEDAENQKAQSSGNQSEISLVKNESKIDNNDTDFALDDYPDDEDYDIGSQNPPKRVKRKKTISKRLLDNNFDAMIQIDQEGKAKPAFPVICSEEGCQESFETAAAFKLHLQGHSEAMEVEKGSKMGSKTLIIKNKGDKPYSCSECKKEYATKQDLKLHFRKHTGEKPFTCDMCGKEFARKAALRIHKISVHTNLKSYLCADCGAAFKANSALIDHKKRVHLQIKPHRCEYCGKEFFSKKDYGEHTRTHTGEKPYMCQLCGKCFGRGYHLKRHTDGVHKHPGGILATGVQVSDSGGAVAVMSGPPQSPGGGGLTIDSFPVLNKKTSKKTKNPSSSQAVTKAPVKMGHSLIFTDGHVQTSPSVQSFAMSLNQPDEGQMDIKPMIPLDEKPFTDIKIYDRAPLDLAQRAAHGNQQTIEERTVEIQAESPLRNSLEINETRSSTNDSPQPQTLPYASQTYTTSQPTYIVS